MRPLLFHAAGSVKRDALALFPNSSDAVGNAKIGNPMWTKFAVLAAGLVWMTSAMQAAEITRQEQSKVIVIKGFIEKNDDKKFALIAEHVPEGGIVMLDSPGGYNATAVAIGNLIINKGYATGVRYGICNSACTLIWLAGSQRLLDFNAKLGFHSAATSIKSSKRSEDGNLNIAFYMRIIGVPKQAIELQSKADPCCFNYVDYKQAKE